MSSSIIHRYGRCIRSRSNNTDAVRHGSARVLVDIVRCVMRIPQVRAVIISAGTGVFAVPNVIEAVFELLAGHRCNLR